MPIEIYESEREGKKVSALDSFFQGLQLAEQGKPDGRVAIVQFGDSHTSGGFITMHLRRELQARFGDAGRGFVLPGKPPIRYYYQRDVEYGSTGEWFAQRGWRAKDGPESVGLGQVRIVNERPGASAWVETCANCPGSRTSSFELFFARAPQNGSFLYRVDDRKWQRVNSRTNTGFPYPDYLKVKVKDGSHRITVKAVGRGIIELFGIALERDQPGVILDQVGVVGLQAHHLYDLNWEHLGEHLVRRAPRLVILQYGTNEADELNLDVKKMEADYVKLIQRIQQAVPGVSILMIGPPDLGTPELPRKECRLLLRERLEEQKQAVPSRKSAQTSDAGTGNDDIPGCTFTTPPVLLDIIAAQRRVAIATGAAFYDTFTAMGGINSMNTMHAQDPPLAHVGRVHFTRAGYRLWADLVLAQLLISYESWARTSPQPASTE